MKAVFIESPVFERHRPDYLNDDEYGALQNLLLDQPRAGDVVKGAGGIRKIRYGQPNRSKGKRGRHPGHLLLARCSQSFLSANHLQ